MKPKYFAPKGTNDILPIENLTREYLREKIIAAAELFGFEKIDTPTFETTNLFARSVGDSSDIVNKEMYTFQRTEDESFALKPEGTAGVVRAYIENGMASLPQPTKLFYITNCFRAERPQKGRLRQFTQFGCEIIGSDSPLADAEIIAVADTLFKSLNITGYSLKINSVGCKECRAKYYEVLKAYIEDNKLELCDDCHTRLLKNPMRVLDCKNEQCKLQLENAPRVTDYLCESCQDHFTGVKSALDAYEIPFEIDTSIVRGLDYYTNTAFEFVSDSLGAQSTICGGGRYNGLIETLGGSPEAGVGFGMGIERLLIVAQEQNVLPQIEKNIKVAIASIGESASNEAIKLASLLRAKGVSCVIDLCQRSLKAQLKYADKRKARYSVMIGEDEIQKGEILLRDMVTKEQKTLPLKQSADIIAQITEEE